MLTSCSQSGTRWTGRGNWHTMATIGVPVTMGAAAPSAEARLKETSTRGLAGAGTATMKSVSVGGLRDASAQMRSPAAQCVGFQRTALARARWPAEHRARSYRRMQASMRGPLPLPSPIHLPATQMHQCGMASRQPRRTRRWRLRRTIHLLYPLPLAWSPRTRTRTSRWRDRKITRG